MVAQVASATPLGQADLPMAVPELPDNPVLLTFLNILINLFILLLIKNYH
jgi:hypothetical protein